MLNERIPVKKYWEQMRYMLYILEGMFNKFTLLKNLNCGLWEDFEALLVSLLIGANVTCFAPNEVRTHRVRIP